MQSDKQPINLIGGGFQHSLSSSGFEPKYITWVKNGNSAPISMYVDHALKITPNKNTENYGWLAESKTINSQIYNWCSENIQILEENFIKVFTHDVSLLTKSKIFTLTQCSSKSFLSNHEIYEKNKLVSIIASNKNYCEEHRFRLEIIEKYRKKCDLFGRGYNEIMDKVTGLKDYCFSFAIENATYSNMFTEKITDCFVTGTIPIYYGMENIDEFFNPEGMIILNENFEIENLSFDLYKSKFKYVIENFEIAKNILSAEDYIYINFLK